MRHLRKTTPIVALFAATACILAVLVVPSDREPARVMSTSSPVAVRDMRGADQLLSVYLTGYSNVLSTIESGAFLAGAQQAEFARLVGERAVADATRAQSVTRAPAISGAAPVAAGGAPCGGDLPPCSVAQRESGNSYDAYNPTGCGGAGCYGRWQFSGEWAGKLGLPADLSTATPEQQDEAARRLWNGGAGCSNWAAC